LATGLFWPAAIVASAFLVRLIYLFQIESIPLFHYLAGDGAAYDEWAQRIAVGDWLGKGVFYQAPLYPYFLGTLQVILGHNLWMIRLLQITLGAISCALIYRVGRKLFSPAAGIAAGLILAFYAPAIFFDALIEKSILDLFLLSLSLLLVSRAMEQRRSGQWLALGASLGFLGLSRENALVLVGVVLPWIGLYFSGELVRTRLRWAGLFLAGLLFVLVPVGLRNLAVGGEFKLTTSQFGPNFYIGNNPAADGTYWSISKMIGEPQLEGDDAARLAERALGRRLSAGEVSDYWFKKSSDYIRSEPARWLRLMGRKWLMVWNAREVEDSDDFYIYRQWSWLVALLGWVDHFGILAPLAAAGIWLTRSEWRRLWLLYAMVLALASSVALFYVFGRYRYPLVPLLALFAGAAIARLLSLFRQRHWRPLPAAFCVLLLSAAIVNWPIYGFSGPGAAGYNNLSNGYYKQGRVNEAIQTALKALELEPDYGVAHYNLGNLYAGQGRFDLAKRSFEEAVRLYPNYAALQSNYGQLLAESGDLDAGVEHFEKAIALNPMLGRAHLNLGVALAQQGKTAAAVGPLQRAAQLNPASPQASFYLGSVYAAEKRYVEAAAAFNQALHIEPDFAPAHQSLAQVLALQGNKEAALRHYQEAVRLMQQGGPARSGR